MNPRINLCTALRQGSIYAKSFFHQVNALTEKNYQIGVVVVVVDGDTLSDAALVASQSDSRVRFIFEGQRGAPTHFMHERSVAWARTGNLALEQSEKTPSEFTLWIESDLSFPCDLIELLMEPKQDIVAPLIMLGGNFYDTWGFRDLSGRRITCLAGLQALAKGPGPLTELSSVGSCLLFRSSLLTEGVRMPSGYEDGLLVGFCLAARTNGARVFCRHDVTIVHPTSLWAAQVYRVTSCRTGGPHDWKEIAPADGAIVAGPYFDFVIPEAVRLQAAAGLAQNMASSVAFATNTQHEIAILLGNGQDLPPPPDGFGAATTPQAMPAAPAKESLPRSAWWRNLLSR